MDPLLDTAPCGFLAFSDDGSIVEVNETLAEMLHYDKPSLNGKKVEELFTIAGRIFYQTHFYPLLKLHHKAEEIFLQLKGNNVEVPVLVNAVRKEVDGVYVNHCILIPVHQRQKYESEILKARRTAEEALLQNEALQRMKSDLEAHKAELDRKLTTLEIINREHIELSGIISHDVQEPIRKIALFADIIMLQEQGMSDEGRDKLQKIRNSCARMRELVYNLDQYVTVGKHATPEIIETNKLIAGVLTKAESKYNIEPMVTIENLPEIEAHKEQLEILFHNLVDNAFKFRSEERPLGITITGNIIQQNSYKNTEGKYHYTDHLRIMLCDNGTGFDARYDSYVFKMFKKIHIDVPGLGFGLAMCKKIVDNHNGTIVCQSEAGVGTCFIITIPVKQ